MEIQSFYQETARRYVNYWISYIESHQLKNDAMDSDIENIFSAFDKAHDHEMYQSLIQGVHGSYLFFEGKGLYDPISEYLTKAKSSAELMDSPDELATSQLYYGRLSMRMGQFAVAKAAWQEGLSLAVASRNEELICNFETELGVIEIQSRNHTESEQHLVRALELARKLKLSERECIILGELCRLTYLKSNYEVALEYCEKALALATANNYTNSTTGLLVYLGAIEEMQGNKQQALAHWERGLMLAKEVGNLQRIGNLLTNLGAITTELGRHQEAEGYLREGINIARKLGETESLSHMFMDLGMLIGHQGDFSEAQKYMTESLILADESGNSHLMSYNLLKQGEYYVEREEWALAKQSFNKCVALTIPFESPLSDHPNLTEREIERGAKSFWGLAKVAAAVDNISTARDMAKKSMSILDEIEHELAEDVRTWLDEIN